MSRIFVSILVLVWFAGIVTPQSRRQSSRKLTKKTISIRADKRSGTSRSVVGLDFRFVTPDQNGGVWISGSAWLLRGLMVNDLEGQTKAIIIPGLSTMSKPHFLSRNVGWTTDFRSPYRTLDGANSWQKVNITDGAEVRTVYFTDLQNGWAGAWNGNIYHTTDAGQTWKKQKTKLDYQIQEIFFVDALHGWAASYKYYSSLKRMVALMKTIDGGDTWQILSNEEADSPRGVHSFVFISIREGWAIDNWQNNIVHTVDGGKTWTIQQRREDHGWNYLSFISDREGWATGGDGIVHTSDGGETWQYQLNQKTSGQSYPEGIAFADSKHGWAIGMSGALRTIDGGSTWRPMPDDWKQMIPSFQMLLKESSSKVP